ncbi:GGDEF domain-containing protein [Actinocatenispora rupis]|uniref:GGDEF domain-containing protein n=1 Tax=Actinocatenispora rupis TaxID=519421 RepID=A0A8J3JC74_9ACTN|nr:GGDEF domain-containing protein [Actinocatenispora rupis]GID15730.1 hypothetical protein Aru02nite_66190 [Actinocatenispora rupis]
MRTQRFLPVAAGTAVLVATTTLLTTTHALGATTTVVLDDLAQLLGALVAAGTAWATAARVAGRTRWWRVLIGCAMFGWGCGQAIWSWYQVFGDTPMPSPGVADIGYLMLPLFALPALLVAASAAAPSGTAAARPRGHTTLVLDGLIVVFSMLLLAWQTTLSAVVHQGAPTRLAFAIAIAYPTTDLTLVVMVILLALVRQVSAVDRLPLLLLGLGLVAISASDSVFAWLVSIGAERMKPAADVGFVAGPALIALAMVAPEWSRIRRDGRRRREWRTDWPHLLLPYLPPTASGIVIALWTALGHRPSAPTIYLGLLVAGLVVVRQLITLVENRILLERVRQAQERLTHQAYHDPLTGLANRTLFAERLAAATGRSGHRPLALMFVDLDDFKAVNDRYGHATGDAVLRDVADRLLSCVRGGDTVARLGGDEFAVLLEGGADLPEVARRVGERILAALAEPYPVAAGTVFLGASLGVTSPPAGATVTPDDLLGRADTAMYAGKRDGKGRMVVAP